MGVALEGDIMDLHLPLQLELVVMITTIKLRRPNQASSGGHIAPIRAAD